MGGVTVLYGDKGYMFHKGSNVAKKIDAWIQKEMRDSQYYGCTVAYKEDNVCNIYMKHREETRLMRCHCPRTQTTVPRGDAGLVRTCKTGKTKPEDPGGAGGALDPMRDDDDAVDGEELMVPRVPSLPPEPSGRQIAEHELTGHAVYRSWCRHRVASNGRAHAHSSREEGELPEIGTEKMCCRSCVSKVGTVQLDAWVRQLLTGRVRRTTRVRS